MIQFRFKLICLVGIAVALFSACSATQIKSVWKDPSYAAHPQRVMVIAVAREPIYRRIIEDEYVLQLKARGVDAIASYSTLPDSSQDDQKAIAKMVEQLGADTVLVSRLVSKRSVRVYYPATISYRPHYYGTWPDYYLHGYESINAPGYSTKYEYALMETNLYEASNDKLIWAVTTETGIENLNTSLIKPYISTILNTMVTHGILRN